MSSASLRNLSRRTKVYWKDYGHWCCGRHLPALVLPATIDRCWLCPNKRPAMDARPPMPEGFDEQEAKAKVSTKAKGTPRRYGQRRKTSELDAMLTGGLAVSEDSLLESEPPVAPRKTGAKATPSTKAAAKKGTAKKTAGGTSAKTAGEAEGNECAWRECDQQARPRSKYCSRNCSNKNARSRHKARDA